MSLTEFDMCCSQSCAPMCKCSPVHCFSNGVWAGRMGYRDSKGQRVVVEVSISVMCKCSLMSCLARYLMLCIIAVADVLV